MINIQNALINEQLVLLNKQKSKVARFNNLFSLEQKWTLKILGIQQC